MEMGYGDVKWIVAQRNANVISSVRALHCALLQTLNRNPCNDVTIIRAEKQ